MNKYLKNNKNIIIQILRDLVLYNNFFILKDVTSLSKSLFNAPVFGLSINDSLG